MKKIGSIVLILLVGGFGLWLYFFPSYSWHQKMTVEVEVDGQVYAGSSVVEMHVSGNPDIGYVTRVRSYELHGEAVVVELPKDQYLFALLTYDVFDTGRVFHDLVGGVVSEPEKGWASRIGDVEEVRAIDPKDFALLVTFTDIKDPKTVKEVDPKNLAAIFGPGVSLKRIVLEITEEDVTEGKIGLVLKWLDTVGDGMLDGRKISTIRAENRLANDLSRLNFRRGN